MKIQIGALVLLLTATAVNGYTASPRPMLILNSIAADDPLPGGNGDGLLGPGESLSLTISLTNRGPTASEYVPRGKVLTDSTPLSIPRTAVQFTWISAGKRLHGTLRDLKLPDCPLDTVLSLWIEISDSMGAFDTLHIPLHVTAQLIDRAVIPKIASPSSPVELAVSFGDKQKCLSPAGIGRVVALIHDRNRKLIDFIELMDDGLHGDHEPRDGYFGGLWCPLSDPQDYRVDIEIVDTQRAVRSKRADLCGFTTTPMDRQGDILVVNDSRSSSPEEEAVQALLDDLDSLDEKYGYWYDWYRGPIDSAALALYQGGVVIWCAPWGGNVSYDNEIQSTLRRYLNNGGNLLLYGQGIGKQIVQFGSDEDKAFYNTVLHATLVKSFSPELFLECLDGVQGSPVGGDLSISVVGEGGQSQYYAEEIDPLPPAQPLLCFVPGGMGRGIISSSGCAGLHVDQRGARLIYYSFGLEGVTDATSRKELLRRSLAWLLRREQHQSIGEGTSENEVLVSHQVYPNPTTGKATVTYFLRKGGEVMVRVCDISGRQVKTLMSGYLPSGYHSATWDGRNEAGAEVASGMYFYTVCLRLLQPDSSGPGFSTTGKILLIR
jgi:hypothetical protein